MDNLEKIGYIINCISDSQKKLSSAITQEEIKNLTSLTSKINMNDFRDIMLAISARNILRSVEDISTYVGLIDMLLCNMKDDIINIQNNLRLAKQQKLLILAAEESARKKRAKQRADARRVLEKRRNRTEKK